jgi:hypothetical protein
LGRRRTFRNKFGAADGRPIILKPELILENRKSQTHSGLVSPRHVRRQVKRERFSAFFGTFGARH